MLRAKPTQLAKPLNREDTVVVIDAAGDGPSSGNDRTNAQIRSFAEVNIPNFSAAATIATSR